MITGQMSVPVFHHNVVKFTNSADCCLPRRTFFLAPTCVSVFTVRQFWFQCLKRSVSIAATRTLCLHGDMTVGLVTQKIYDFRLKLNIICRVVQCLCTVVHQL